MVATDSCDTSDLRTYKVDSLEESIRNAVANQKNLEAMEVQTQIAEKEA